MDGSTHWAKRPRFDVISPGRLAYQAYYRPLGAWKRMLGDGGPIEQWKTERGRREMEAVAARLPPLLFSESKPVELHVLSGRGFWYQTIFCLWSFANSSGRHILPYVYDDGSLNPSMSDAVRRLWPKARIIPSDEIQSRLEETLPRSRFPFLRERWDAYPNIRKLTDVHLGSAGWKLVLDSDLLFFRRPDFLLSWCDAPDRPLHAVDVEES
jgi:hypothetical protein